MEDRHIVAIDLGSCKTALAVAKINEDDIQVIYYKEIPSAGIRNSYVFNSMKASKPIKELIDDAEHELNIRITQAVIGMPKYRIRQETNQAQLSDLNPEECITDEDVNCLKTAALETYPLENPRSDELFGAVAQSFSTGEDFQFVESDIIGMPSEVLEGNFKIFIGKKSALHAIDVAFNNLKVGIAKKYFTPDTLAKAVLTSSEMENGVALIDFGGGVTSVSVYYGNIMRHYASIPFGGASVTSDIKTECLISDSLAENIKLAFGACMPDKLQNLSEKIIQINSGNNSPNKQLPVKYLSEIITYRVKEIMEAIMYEIEQSGFADNLRNGIVLTGGGANLTNCANYIKELSGYNVRTGYPKHLFSAIGCEGVYETDAAVTIGLILALWLYVRRTKVNLWRVLDNVAIATPVPACCIRLGNLMNSEIIGKVTDVPWAFVFERVDLLPRHPGQLYEALAYALFFFVGWHLYRKRPERVGTGFFFGLCITLIFAARFFIEFTKDIQEAFEASMPLNMGQLLSLPFVAAGLVCMFNHKLMRRLGAEK